MSILLKLHTNALLSLPKSDRQKIAQKWREDREHNNLLRKQEEERKQEDMRKLYGEFADSPDFFEF